MGSKLKATGWITAGVLTGALATVSVQTLARNTTTPLPLDELQQLAAVYGMVKHNYVEDANDNKLITDAIKGMVSGLDPHSEYYDKKSYEEFKEGTSGKFVGLGIEITTEDGLIKVVSPIEGTPADKAGIQAGDLITRIDDKTVRGLSITEAVKRMRGKANTQVTLTISRKSENRVFPVTITRAEIRTQSVRGKMVEPGYAWIRISQFQERTVADFAKKIEEVYKEDPNIKGIVLDLRNDPGGLLDAAVAISAAFLPQGVPVVSTKGQLPESNTLYKAIPQDYAAVTTNGDPLSNLPAALKDVPIVVLVNQGSASASEIVSGALQDHKRATIMGIQTFGKGSVQTVRPLTRDTALKITTARYYTPNGTSIQAQGVIPDIMVDETAQGSPYAALSMRESDLDHHITNDNVAQLSPAEEKARAKEREAALERFNEQMKKDPDSVKQPEFGSDKDFQLQQALNKLKGQPVQVSKTLQAVRKNVSKDKADAASAPKNPASK